MINASFELKIVLFFHKTTISMKKKEKEKDTVYGNLFADARSGASFDACVLKRFLAANRVPQRLPVLCLTPSEVMTRNIIVILSILWLA